MCEEYACYYFCCNRGLSATGAIFSILPEYCVFPQYFTKDVFLFGPTSVATPASYLCLQTSYCLRYIGRCATCNCGHYTNAMIGGTRLETTKSKAETYFALDMSELYFRKTHHDLKRGECCCDPRPTIFMADDTLSDPLELDAMYDNNTRKNVDLAERAYIHSVKVSGIMGQPWSFCCDCSLCLESDVLKCCQTFSFCLFAPCLAVYYFQNACFFAFARKRSKKEAIESALQTIRAIDESFTEAKPIAPTGFPCCCFAKSGRVADTASDPAMIIARIDIISKIEEIIERYAVTNIRIGNLDSIESFNREAKELLSKRIALQLANYRGLVKMCLTQTSLLVLKGESPQLTKAKVLELENSKTYWKEHIDSFSNGKLYHRVLIPIIDDLIAKHFDYIGVTARIKNLKDPSNVVKPNDSIIFDYLGYKAIFSTRRPFQLIRQVIRHALALRNNPDFKSICIKMSAKYGDGEGGRQKSGYMDFKILVEDFEGRWSELQFTTVSSYLADTELDGHKTHKNESIGHENVSVRTANPVQSLKTK